MNRCESVGIDHGRADVTVAIDVTSTAASSYIEMAAVTTDVEFSSLSMAVDLVASSNRIDGSSSSRKFKNRSL